MEKLAPFAENVRVLLYFQAEWLSFEALAAR